MCVPPIENDHFFWKSSDLPSKTLTFLSRSCQIRSGSSQINSETCILLRKSTHFGLHTEVNLKNRFCASAKSLKVLDGRSCIFQKKCAFRLSVVTSMCAPPIENAHFFSNLQTSYLKRILFSPEAARSSRAPLRSARNYAFCLGNPHILLSHIHIITFQPRPRQILRI